MNHRTDLKVILLRMDDLELAAVRLVLLDLADVEGEQAIAEGDDMPSVFALLFTRQGLPKVQGFGLDDVSELELPACERAVCPLLEFRLRKFLSNFLLLKLFFLSFINSRSLFS
jgi:hypothetical protein